MADVQLDDLADRIRPYVPGCPSDSIKQALIDVMRDFCNFTRCYKYEVESETIMALVSDYDIEMPNLQVEPIAIEHMAHGSAEVKFRDPSWMARMLGANWRTRETDDFRYFTQIQTKSFCFPCIPQNNQTLGALSYRVALRPIAAATTIDDAQSSEWIDSWSPGVLARLYAIPKKQWSDAALAGSKQKEYLQARGLARIRVEQAYGNAELQWVNPRGFA